MWPFFKDIRISLSKDDENPDSADRDLRRATSMLGQRFLPPPHFHLRAAANKNSKVRTFLQSEVILAGPCKFKSCLNVKTFNYIWVWIRIRVGG